MANAVPVPETEDFSFDFKSVVAPFMLSVASAISTSFFSVTSIFNATFDFLEFATVSTSDCKSITGESASNSFEFFPAFTDREEGFVVSISI